MPWLKVNHTRLTTAGAVPTPLFALEVQRAGMLGCPGAGLRLRAPMRGSIEADRERADKAKRESGFGLFVRDGTTERRTELFVSAAARLMRTYVAQVDAARACARQ